MKKTKYQARSPIIKKSRAKNIILFTIIALGIALMPTGFVLGNVIQDKIDEGIADQIRVPNPDSSDYDEWESNDYDDAPEIYTTYYLWNLTNPDEFLAGETPIYEEVGPFVFREFKYKYDVKYADDNNEVTYKEYSKFVQVYGDNISEVKITNLNPGFLGSVVVAGGTDMNYNQLIFPYVLKQLRDEFYTIYTEAIEATLNDHVWIEDTLRKMMKYCSHTLGFIGSVADLFLDSIDINVIETFLRNGLPTWEEVFYEEWANDYFPQFQGDYNYLKNNVDNDDFLIGWIIELILKDILSDPDIHDVMDNSITKTGADLVDETGSDNGEGVDIDGMYGYRDGTRADLNISTTTLNSAFFESSYFYLVDYITMKLIDYTPVGGSGLTYAQCVDLWDQNNPNSLTGMDYEVNKTWFDAAEGDVASKNFLKTEFSINDAQLDYILKWINVSTSTWEPNAIEYTINSWNSGVITSRTVEEWLYTANDTGIANYMKYYGKDPERALVNIFDNCQNIADAEKAEVGSFTIKTGRDDISEIGQTIDYNGQDTIYIWAKPEEIEGTDGLQFAPGVTRDDTLKTFQPDLMRVVELEYDEDAEIYDIDLLRYRLSGETFSVNPNYYMDTHGLVNLAPIEKYQGIAIRVSKPHFFGCDYRVLTGVEGMEPNGNLHDTYIDVEPLTGIVMNANKRIQINVELWQTEFYIENISHTVIPILWFQQGGEISEDLAKMFKDLIYGAIELRDSVPLYCIGIGAAVCIPGVIIASRRTIKLQKLEEAKELKKVKQIKSLNFKVF